MIVSHIIDLFKKQNPRDSDVLMYDGSGRKLYLHKIILVSNSYFESYFDFEDRKMDETELNRPIKYNIEVQSIEHAKYLIGTIDR